ncbi:MAG: GLPGLI family protein [Bacteroidia bacterium]
MKKIIYLIVFLSFSSLTEAQQLILQGKIHYERKENLHKLFTEENEWTNEFKKQLPKYRVDIFELSFNTKRSLYKMEQEFEGNSNILDWFNVAKSNIVSQNIENQKVQAQKVVYENTYQINDSLPKITWKLHNEYRTIAGFSCRKASTIILDSVYIIAFFTDEIPVSGGPESMNGLPGMIMGLVVPRLNTTWFATRVDHVSVSDESLVFYPKAKKKINTMKTFLDELKLATKNWGKESGDIIWRSVL